MARFYLDAPISNGQTIILPVDIVRHLQVLRIHDNEIIHLFNGNGSEFSAKLLSLDKKQAIIQVIEQIKSEQLPLNTTSLAIGLIANDKMDLVMQKSTELGVKEIIPWYGKYTQRISPDRLKKRLEHWQNIIISSCMQCGQNYIPTICQPIQYKDLLDMARKYNLKVILSSHDGHNHMVVPSIKSTEKIQALLVVGAEGGFSLSESTLAVENGFIPVKLGNLILRAETATMAGLSLLNTKLGIW